MVNDQPQRIDYIKIYIEVEACPVFTHTEKKIISNILSLSDKYIASNGCTYTNRQLAHRHNTTPKRVSYAITKATNLGFIITRKDITEKKRADNAFFFKGRSLVMKIPKEWKFMGDLYNRCFIQTVKPEAELLSCFKNICKAISSLSEEVTQASVKKIINKYTPRIIHPTRLAIPPHPNNGVPPHPNNGVPFIRDIYIRDKEKEYCRAAKLPTVCVKRKKIKRISKQLSLSRKYQDILKSHKKITRSHNPSNWHEDFRKMIDYDKIPVDRIEKVMEWYDINMDKMYTPEAFSAKSFRGKFDRLEAAMIRGSNGRGREGAAKVETGKYKSRSIKVNS